MAYAGRFLFSLPFLLMVLPLVKTKLGLSLFQFLRIWGLLRVLKNSFKDDDLDKAFDLELKIFLEKINPVDIPDNLTSFYYTNIQIEKDEDKKIKFNNDIMHQSKLINYFNGDYASSKISKDTNNFLKKI